MSGKRKRVVIAIEQKIDAVYRLENGEPLKKVADLNVGTSTVSEWKKNKNDLIKFASKTACSTIQRKTMRKFENEELNEAVFLWFMQQREKGIPLTGPLIQEKAKVLALQFGESSKPFTASSGWLDRWKCRYGIRQLNMSGEKLLADERAVNFFINGIKSLIKDYTRDQIFNADESGLNFAPGYKNIKERITILACANASGNHRLPIMVIGKSKKPRTFKNISHEDLPVIYKNQRSSWVSGELFKEWFYEHFTPSITEFLESKNLPIKALLIYAPSHPEVSELRNGDIIAHFLPPNVASLLRPIDQGFMDYLKRSYRKLLLESLLNESKDSKSLDEVLKRINLKDVIYCLAEAWDNLKEFTLEKSWSKVIEDSVSEIPSENTIDEISSEEMNSLIKKFPGYENVDNSEVVEWLNSDTHYELTDQEIVEVVLESTDEDEDNSVIVETERIVTAEEAFNALQVALNFVKQSEEATPDDVLLMKRWLGIAAIKRTENDCHTKKSN
ncbi:jerky protein homolog-like [Halyomorpha halys]|uniref:jerky protein homolog-like n=1 Tax=Halyomorpha halys TaxID=286706 RepID=UPI0006D522B6|nr:jerky protein homolog-like [Halyomorpha halys]